MNTKGFTLVELLVTLSIISLVIIIAIPFFIMGYNTFIRESNRLDNLSSVRNAMTLIVTDIRKASELELDGDRLILQLDDEVITYQKSANNLTRNGIIKQGNIQHIEFVLNGKELSILIRSILDKAGNYEESSMTVYIRGDVK